MNAILGALEVLVIGAAASLALLRRARSSLSVGLLAIGIAGALCVWGAGAVLLSATRGRTFVAAWPMPLGCARFTIDGLSAWFLLAIGIVSLSTAIYSWTYFQRNCERAGVVGSLLCVLVAGMIISVSGGDAFLFLLGWELMSLSAFLLISFDHRESETRRAAWMYLLAMHLGSALFLLPMFAILVTRARTTDFSAFRTALQSCSPAGCATLFMLGLLGFGTKAGFMPMHVWLPVAHPAAPTPVSTLLSGVVIKTGIYGLLRLLDWLPALPVSCGVVMLLFGASSGVLGVLYALAQHQIKRLLAYHSVENIGIIGLGIGMAMLGETFKLPACVALGYAGALLHVLNHALFKGLLFLSAGTVIHATGTGEIDRLGGLARKTPANAALFLIGAISICGLPPFNGFVSEWLVYGSLFSGSITAIPPVAGIGALAAVSLALMGGLALACFAKVFSVIFLGEPRDLAIQPHPTPWAMRSGMVILAILCAGIGLAPGLVVPLVAGAVCDVAHVSTDAFGNAVGPALAPVSRLSWLFAVLLGFAVGLAAVRRAAMKLSLVEPSPRAPTWGCAYALPSERMQYTASSFAWPLVQSFRHLLWPDRRVVAPLGPFPARSEVESHTPDIAEHDLLGPIFRGARRMFLMIRTVSWSGELMAGAPAVDGEGRIGPIRALSRAMVAGLRRGGIHASLAMIALTLVIVFLAASFTTPLHAPLSPSAAPTVDSVKGLPK